MTKHQFRNWQRRMGWTNAQAAAELRVSRSQVLCYRSGRSAITPQAARLCELLAAGQPKP